MEKNSSKKLLWFWGLVFISLIVLLFLLAVHLRWIKGPAQISQPGYYSIAHFTDGDTIAVDMNGKVEDIRMIGVDTPETHRPNSPVECYGQEAANYTQKLIGKSKVRLQADPLDTNRDRYGRLLRYVYLPDGTLIEDKLISEGYGFAYVLFPFSKTDDFKAKEQSAKTKGLGLWAACQVSVQSNGSEHTNPIGQ